MTARWLNTDTGTGLLHARARTPDRWDVSVERRWPVAGALSRRRIAAQIRQDIWRGVQATRGFTPRVLVATDTTHIHITGGGSLASGRAAPILADRIADILDNPQNRRRWVAHARARKRMEDLC